MNRIGDLAFLIAIFWMINRLDTVSYGDVFAQCVPSLAVADITCHHLVIICWCYR